MPETGAKGGRKAGALMGSKTGTVSIKNLLSLPPEILLQVVAHMQTARALSNLSITCKSLHELVEQEGWKTFVRNRFPSFTIPPFWKDGAHSLSTLSRNWDRRAFLARSLQPAKLIYHLPSGQTSTTWQMPVGQTMGFQAVVDSHETWPGNTWRSRNEIVAWGAGAQLIVRTKGRGDKTQYASRDSSKTELIDQECKWLVYRDSLHSEGRDDIVSVNILRVSESSSIRVVVGRASGELNLLRLAKDKNRCASQRFDTSGSSVRSTDIYESPRPLLVAGLGDERATLYPLHGDGTQVSSLSETRCVDEKEVACRTWSIRFLSNQSVAVGRGPSKTLVHVYGIGPEGFSQPIRAFGSGRGSQRTTSVYPLLNLPDSSGNVFFSGGYDGCIRLHDMRSSEDHEALIIDPVDQSAIFSLAALGRERIIAGASRNSLVKVFDLRMTGGRAYSYLDAAAEDMQQTSARANLSDTNRTSTCKSGWNIFATEHSNAQTPRSYHRQFVDGPVYSLSRPSDSSPSLYVGLESRLIQFNFTSMFDKHPDPVFEHVVYRSAPDRKIDPITNWWPRHNSYLNLAMYEQVEQGSIPVLVQRGPFGTRGNMRADSITRFKSAPAGYDLRWEEKRGR